MANIRKLLNIETLDKAVALVELGVPMVKVHSSLFLDGYWSYQTTVNLVKADMAGFHKATRPTWLLASDQITQTPPTNWKFVGTFPKGEWVKTGELTND